MRAVFPALLALLSGSIGYALAMAFNRTVPGPTAGDWLTAGSAGIGVVVTILSAVWVEEYRRKSEDRRELRRIRDALSELHKTAKDAHDGPLSEWDGSDPEHYAAIAVLGEFLQAIKTYRFVRANVRITDSSLWASLNFIDEEIEKAQATVDEGFERLLENPNSKEAYEVTRSKVSNVAASIRVPAFEARDRAQQLM